MKIKNRAFSRWHSCGPITVLPLHPSYRVSTTTDNLSQPPPTLHFKSEPVMNTSGTATTLPSPYHKYYVHGQSPTNYKPQATTTSTIMAQTASPSLLNTRANKYVPWHSSRLHYHNRTSLKAPQLHSGLHRHLRSFSHHHLGSHLTPHTSILLLAGSEVTGRTVMPMARRTMGTGAREPGEACLATWVSPSVTFSTANEGTQH